ncbi:MAG: methyltransferase domain-containing protein [Desulfobacter sp.]
MKKWLSEQLICPECIESEAPLALDAVKEDNGDILEGSLVCEGCGSRYDIRDGVAVVVPQKTLPHIQGDTGYNSTAMLSAYLWSQFSEFFNGPDATDAYRRWASLFSPAEGWAVDIGCSVGRLAFELSSTHTRVVGVDTSPVFIRQARKLMTEKALRFDMIIEGRITEERSCDMDPAWNLDAVEFIVADAMALPFRRDRFATAASVNILEKVPDPAQHLTEINRILQPDQADFLFSDPFSWDENVSDPGLWLSGRNSGPAKGRGVENICRIMTENPEVFSPVFTIRDTGEVLWKIRKTENLWEYITSQFIFGTRGR